MLLSVKYFDQWKIVRNYKNLKKMSNFNKADQ